MKIKFLLRKNKEDFVMSKKPVVLMILDGYGLSDKKEGNGIANANTPVMDKLMAEYPFVKGYASGLAVGLPDGQMGNSEVGHLNMGAGRIYIRSLQELQSLLKMVISLKMKNFLVQLRTVRRIILIYIFMDFFQTVVFTAILHMYLHFLSLQREMVLKMYMFTVLWMDVIRQQTEEKISLTSFITRWTKSA